MASRSGLSSRSPSLLLISPLLLLLMASPSELRSLLLDRAEELGLAPSGLPWLLEELARWLPSAEIEAFLADLPLCEEL